MFRFVGGVLCLDFVNTASWADGSEVNDHLSDVEALFAWAREAKIPEAREASPPPALLQDAKRLRVILRRVLVPLAHGEQPPEAALRSFEREAKRTLAAAQLAPRSGSPRLEFVWQGDAAGCGVLERVTWSALALVRSRKRLGALRECEGETCGWLFVDTSRNHLRRWCEMRTCGGVAKARAYRARRR